MFIQNDQRVRRHDCGHDSEMMMLMLSFAWVIKCPHGSHHPTIRYMVNAMATISGDVLDIPKMGQLPTPVLSSHHLP